MGAILLSFYYLLWCCRECNGSGDEVEMIEGDDGRGAV